MRKRSELDRFAPTDCLDGAGRVFLVGIGGAGMSALARMLRTRGIPLAGSDSTEGSSLDGLRSLGIEVHVGHQGGRLKKGDVVVLSDAIALEDSPEVAEALGLGLPLLRRSQLLGWLLRGRKQLCITGTHGKTTTTGMAASGLIAAGFDPLVVAGADIPAFGGPVREGNGEWAVVEACEAYESYLDLDPALAVLTNLDLDHVDFHGTWENLVASVRAFLAKLPEGSPVVVSGDPGGGEAAQGRPSKRALPWGGPPLALPGEHNRANAACALAACILAGADEGLAAEGIASFQGAERRLQVLQEGPITIVDDYAHTPVEVEASLKALREKFPGRRLVAVYQPHLYSRTAHNIQGFADALSLADLVVLTDIYPAREAPLPGVSAVLIGEKIKSVPHLYVPSRHLLPPLVAKELREGDVVVGMGAGTIGEFAPALVEELKRGEPPLVLVLAGGIASEREVSLHSGAAVAAAVEKLGYPLLKLDPIEVLMGRQDIRLLSGPRRPSCALLPIHGRGAEDGPLQGLLDLLGIPYCGCGLLASAIAIDKQRTKEVLAAKGIDVPRGVQITRTDLAEGRAAGLVAGFSSAVVKPNREGSTVGLSFVEREEDILPAVERALAYDVSCLVEEWLRGVEISCPVLHTRALLPVEIAPKDGQYDFANKYTPGKTHEPCPPPSLSEDQIRKSQEIALAVHQALGCRGVTRTDMIVTSDRIVALEINTLPGMTPTSLVPISARADGMSFEDLVEWMIRHALEVGAA